MNNDEKSLMAISKFVNLINYGETNGHLVELNIEVYKNDEFIYDEKTNCSISENYKYGNIEINVIWKADYRNIKRLGLYGMYNSKFQSFDFDGKKLIIICDNGLKIYLWKS